MLARWRASEALTMRSMDGMPVMLSGFQNDLRVAGHEKGRGEAAHPVTDQRDSAKGLKMGREPRLEPWLRWHTAQSRWSICEPRSGMLCPMAIGLTVYVSAREAEWWWWWWWSKNDMSYSAKGPDSLLILVTSFGGED